MSATLVGLGIVTLEQQPARTEPSPVQQEAQALYLALGLWRRTIVSLYGADAMRECAVNHRRVVIDYVESQKAVP